MFAAGYTTAQPLAPRIFDRVRPLPGNLVKSLEKFQRSSSANAPVEGKLLWRDHHLGGLNLALSIDVWPKAQHSSSAWGGAPGLIGNPNEAPALKAQFTAAATPFHHWRPFETENTCQIETRLQRLFTGDLNS
jgi:hypothetical protein